MGKNNEVCDTLEKFALVGDNIKEYRQILLRDGYTSAMAEKAICEDGTLPMFRNSRYIVTMETTQVSPEALEMVHLSIRCINKNQSKSWGDFQRIKNELVGEEHEAVELYPAESRSMYATSQYHLWVLPEKVQRFPVGYWIQQPRTMGNERTKST